MGGKTSQSSQTIQIPPEVLARYNAVNARAEGVSNKAFERYSTDPNAFVQGLSDTQKAGISNINAASGAASPYFGEATTYGRNAAQSVNPAELGSAEINKYMSPYLQNVLGSTSALLNQQNQQAMAGQTGNAIRSGAFGGDRAGIAAANLTQQQNLASGKILSDIANQGYGQALATAQQQQGLGYQAGAANRAAQLAASQQMANLGLGAQGAALQGAQAQLGAGQLEQQTGQAGKTALYNQFMQEQSYPFQVAQFLANIAEGTGALSGSTTTTQQPGGFFSDERLKEDIHEIGKTFDGQPIYKYKYKGDPRSQIGLIAQDVEQHHPHAVGLAGGYKTVDYDAATKDAEHKGHFASGGLVPESMGGHVHPSHMGEGFADGGSPVLPGLSSSDISALLAAQAKMFGPFSGEGMDISGQPHGGAQGYVPQASLPVAGLATASGNLETPESGLAQAAEAGESVGSLAKTYQSGKEAYESYKDKQEAELRKKYKDNVLPGEASGGLVGYADGGFAEEDQNKIAQPKPAMPEAGLGAMPTGAAKAPNEGQSKLDIPNEQKAPQLAVAGGNLPKPRTGMDDVKDIASLAATAAAIMAARGGSIKKRDHLAQGGLPNVIPYGQQGGLNIPTGSGEHHELLTAKGPSSSGGFGLGDLAQLGLAGAMIFGGGGEGAAAAAPKAGGGLAAGRKGYAWGGADDSNEFLSKLASNFDIPQLHKDFWLQNKQSSSDYTDEQARKQEADQQRDADINRQLQFGTDTGTYTTGSEGNLIFHPQLTAEQEDINKGLTFAGEGNRRYTLGEDNKPKYVSNAYTPPAPTGLAAAEESSTEAPSTTPRTLSLGDVKAQKDYSAEDKPQRGLASGIKDVAAITEPAPVAEALGDVSQMPTTTASGATGAGGLSPKEAPNVAPVAAAPTVDKGLASAEKPAAVVTKPAATKTDGEPSHWYTDPKNLIPLLQGVAAMGTAPTRSLGVALSAGTAAGLKGYQQQRQFEIDKQAKQAEIDQTKALTRGVNVDTAAAAARNVGNSKFTFNGMEYVILENGQYMPAYKWQNLPADKQPPLLGTSVAAGTGHMPDLFTAPIPKAPVEATSATTPTAAPTGAVAPSATAYDAIEKNSIANMSSGAEALRGYTQNTIEGRQAIADRASASFAQEPQLFSMSAAVSKIPESSVLSGNTYGNFLRGVALNWNSFARSVGHPELEFGDEALTEAAIRDKAAAATQLQLGGNSVEALRTAAAAIPTGEMTKDASIAITANMLLDKQRAIDEAAYENDVYGHLKNKIGYDVNQSRNQFRQGAAARYADEKNKLTQLLNAVTPDGQSIVGLLLSGRTTPQAVDKYMNSPGISRYFISGNR